MDTRRVTPGIDRLLELEQDHTTALYSDFRRLYAIGFGEVGRSISWREGTHLVEALTLDPSSLLAASLGGWRFPASHEWMVLANIYDLTLRLNSKKGKPMERPWENVTSRIAPSRIRSREEIDSILKRMNPARGGGHG
jgi:hypothetical protein